MKTSFSWLAIPMLVAIIGLGWWLTSDRGLSTAPRDEVFGDLRGAGDSAPEAEPRDSPSVAKDVRPIRSFPSIALTDDSGFDEAGPSAERPISTALKVLMDRPEELVLQGTIRGPDRKSLPGAKLEVWSVVTGVDGAAIMNVHVASTQSDSDGRISVGGFVRLGETYLARITHPDFAPLRVEGLDPMRRSSFRGTWLMDEGGRLEGQVLGAGQSGIAGAEAQVFSLENSGRHPDGVLEATTFADGEGRFAFEHLGYGSKRVLVSAPGFSTEEAMPIRVVPLAKGAKALRLRFALKAGSTISGRVESEVNGLKLEGIQLRIRSLAARPVQSGPAAQGHLGLTTLSETGGRFSFAGLPKGRYVISAEERSCIPINAQAGADNLVLQVSEGGVIAGRVELESTQELVTRFAVGAAPGTRASGLPWNRVLRVESSDGAFRITGLKPGPHMVMIQVSGCAPLSIGPFEVDPNQPVKGVIARVKVGSVVEGRVVGESGDPLPGASVWLNEIIPGQSSVQGAGLARRPLEVRRGQALTFADGSFALPNVGPGRYFIAASCLEHLSARSQTFKILGGQDTVMADLRLRPAASVHGQVVDATGRGDFQAIVYVQSVDSTNSANGPSGSKGGLHSAPTDSEGRFFVEGLAPGRYRLWVRDSRGSVSSRVRPASEEGTVVALRAGRPERVTLSSQ